MIRGPLVCALALSCLAISCGVEDEASRPTERDRPMAEAVRECDAGRMRRRDLKSGQNLQAGPVTFVASLSLRDQALLYEPIRPESIGAYPKLEPIAERGELYSLVKQLVVLDGDEDVVVSIARSNERPAGLDYDYARERPESGAPFATVEELLQTVKFEGCGGLEDYPGAVLSEGPQCLRLEVWVGDAASPVSIGLPLGADCQPDV